MGNFNKDILNKLKILLKTAKNQSMHMEHIGPIEEACELTSLIEEIMVEVDNLKEVDNFKDEALNNFAHLFDDMSKIIQKYRKREKN